MFEKTKVKAYLQEVECKSAFHFLLADYASGEMKKTLKAMKFSQIKTAFEWGELYKRITVTAENKNGLYLFFSADTKEEHFLAVSYEEEAEPKRITPHRDTVNADYLYNEIRMLMKTFEYHD